MSTVELQRVGRMKGIVLLVVAIAAVAAGRQVDDNILGKTLLYFVSILTSLVLLS